ncbi:hypothetical protein JW707_03100 [Candidatus Woesearchaeota archaeon]|nr:hypothetical protein [Candidatus Woesearchaeota archaeon]
MSKIPEIQEGVITDESVKTLFEDHSNEPVPAIIADYYTMLGHLRGIIETDARLMFNYAHPKFSFEIVEGDFRKEPVHASLVSGCAGLDTAEYSLIHSIVARKKGFFPWSEHAIVRGFAVLENFIFDDYLDMVVIALDRPLTDADFEGKPRSLDVAVLDAMFAGHIETMTQQYARKHNFPPVRYRVEQTKQART